MRYARLFPALLLALSLNACDWNNPKDYKPKQDFQAWQKKVADAQNAGGAGGAAAAEAPGQKTFETYCAACHGVSGKADGAAGLALVPKPRNFTDKAWQAKVDDAHIHKVIKEGGASVGLSASMAPWGAAIPDAEIDNVVKYVRQLGK